MDSITRTASSALTKYYDILRRMGNIYKQDKYKLLVLWFFNYLKNDSDFLYKWDDENKRFVVDRTLEQFLEKKFRENVDCLSNASCFIKLLPDDNCTPILEINWDLPINHIPDRPILRVLVPNATAIVDRNNNKTDVTEIYNLIDVIDSINWNEGGALTSTFNGDAIGHIVNDVSEEN